MEGAKTTSPFLRLSPSAHARRLPRKVSDSFGLFYPKSQCDIRLLCFFACSVFPLAQFFLKLTLKLKKEKALTSPWFFISLQRGFFSTRLLTVSHLLPLFMSELRCVLPPPIDPQSLFQEMSPFSRWLCLICYASYFVAMHLGARCPLC